MPAKQQKIKVKIDDSLNPVSRLALGDLIIEYILQRTQDKRVDKKGRPFKPYSKEYIDSKNFMIGGKSKGKVNLTLSGDMLADLSILKHSKGSITIGYDANTDSNAKAEGNILGTYGQKQPIGKARDFLGINQKELKPLEKIVKKEKPEDKKKFFNVMSDKFKQKELKGLQRKGLLDKRINIATKEGYILDDLYMESLDDYPK